MSDTALALERMTDAAKFEKLAMAVLRRIRPEYRGLIHTGINTEGKTVKSPLDGIFVVPGSDPPHFVIVHHTTTAKRDDLRKKWLHEDLPGKTSKTPDGDVVKAARWAEEKRKKNPAVRVTLILTCNRIPPEDLVTEVGLVCHDSGIESEIVDLSRLQDFLDIDRDGQWIRKQYLGIEQERLSEDLLQKLSERSYKEYMARGLFGSLEEEWVPRSMDGELHEAVFQGRSGSVTLLVAGSGHGKSTATCRLLGKHLRTGKFGLWLEPEIVRQAPTIEAAIAATLRGFHPQIEIGCGTVAIELARQQGDLLLVVDDINKAPSPASLIQKVAGWDGRKQPRGDGQSEGRDGYRIVCPAWPQVIGQLVDSAEEALQSLCFFAGPFSPEEGADALQRQARFAGIELTGLEAHELSERLGHDPLLISLWSKTRGEVKSDGVPVSAQVIHRFVLSRLAELSDSAPEGGVMEDYRETLLALARRMIEERTLDPSWKQISGWFPASDHANRLRRLTNQREVMRLDGEGEKRNLAFRHDRIRDHLLARGFQDWMAHEEVPSSLLGDPYYADILGQALLLGALDPSWASRLAKSNPLALFYSLRTFRRPTSPMEQAILETIRQWLRDELIPDRCVRPLRWAADWLLAETDSPLVLELTEDFPSPSFPLLEARMRNRDVEAAAEYCFRLQTQPSSRRDILVEHVIARFGKNFVQDLAALLAREDLPEQLRIGALYLAGHLADPELAPAIDRSWAYGNISIGLIRAVLWAGLRCYTDPTLLNRIFGLWSTLSDEAVESDRLPDRTAVVGYGMDASIAWVGLKDTVITFLLLNAKEGPLARPLFIILNQLDHPEALEFCLRHPTWARSSSFSWRVKVVRSRDHLRRIWENEAEDDTARWHAFALWTRDVGEEETGTLQAIAPTSLLYDQALRRRAELGDRSCIIEIVSKVETDPFIWWFRCAKIWSEPIREALQRHFDQRSRQMTKSWNCKETNEDWPTCWILSQIPPREAEELIEKHWPHLRFSPRFVQAALYVGTAKTRALAAEAIQESPYPKRLFEQTDFGEIRHPDSKKTGLSPEHLDSFAPYLHLLDEHGIDFLWRACNTHGFFAWRRDHVDPLLSPKSSRYLGVTDEDLFAKLDEFATDKTKTSWGFIDYWLEEFQQRGDPEDRAMKVVSAWLRERGTFEALQVAANCVATGGTRKDLALLENPGFSAENSQVAKLLEATRFEVFRRSLQ